MAVCNLFNKFMNNSGNFMLFSQYTEDITRNFAESDNYKVVPTKFVALDIDYSKVINKEDDLNYSIPNYFQYRFENACAWCKDNQLDYKEIYEKWSPTVFKNLFWNTLYEGGYITEKKYDEITISPEVMYWGDINMHSYNNHQGMGYGEIYCYIPSEAKRMLCKIETTSNNDYPVTNNNDFLQGYPDKFIPTFYSREYNLGNSLMLSIEENNVSELTTSESVYNINTIIVLYSVFQKNDDTSWNCIYDSIPLGMYFTGKFEGTNISNTIKKYVTTSYEVGTSYGLRICSRFTSTASNGILTNTDIIVDNSDYNNVCNLMTKMNENLDLMLNVTKSAANVNSSYKELLSILKNNRTNVPYVKNVNGVDCWFVNGKLVSTVANPANNNCCDTLSMDVIKQRIENINDNNPNNDYTKIYDKNECKTEEATFTDIYNEIKEINGNDFDFNWEYFPENCNHTK